MHCCFVVQPILFPSQNFQGQDVQSRMKEAEDEIQHLRNELRRYQQADPIADFVHKVLTVASTFEQVTVRNLVTRKTLSGP